MRAGMKLGDVIIKVDGRDVNTQSAFEEEISYHYPGDKISITYIRNGDIATASLTLVNRNGNTEVIKRQIVNAANLGVQLEATEYGVKVFQMKPNSVLKRIGIPENFTIIALNRERVKEPKEVIDFFEKFRGRGELYGINSSRQQVQFPFIIR